MHNFKIGFNLKFLSEGRNQIRIKLIRIQSTDYEHETKFITQLLIILYNFNNQHPL